VPGQPVGLLPEKLRRQSLRQYLDKLKPDTLRKLLFRNPYTEVRDWVPGFQLALAPMIQQARSILVAALPELAQTVAAMNEQQANAGPFASVGEKVASALVAAAYRVPPLAMIMLAEVSAEILKTSTLADMKLSPKQRNELVDDALRQLLVQTGLLSSLQSGLSGDAAKAALRVLSYVKAVFGMDGTSQGTVAAIVDAARKKTSICLSASSILGIICLEARRAAGAKAMEACWRDSDLDDDASAKEIHDRMLLQIFRNDWLNHIDNHEAQLRKGNYFLRLADGTLERCTSLRRFAAYLGCADGQPLPEVILHFAGERLKRYINDYLLRDACGEASTRFADLSFQPDASITIQKCDSHVTLHYYGVHCDFETSGKAPVTRVEESDVFIEDTVDGEEDKNEDQDDDAPSALRLEIRLEASFRHPDRFRIRNAFIAATEY
jgi:hypothetical protein